MINFLGLSERSQFKNSLVRKQRFLVGNWSDRCCQMWGKIVLLIMFSTTTKLLGIQDSHLQATHSRSELCLDRKLVSRNIPEVTKKETMCCLDVFGIGWHWCHLSWSRVTLDQLIWCTSIIVVGHVSHVSVFVLRFFSNKMTNKNMTKRYDHQKYDQQKYDQLFLFV
jgi:hypothetical protein